MAHLTFALHRVTGWLLLGWIVVHLAFPALQTAPTAVFIPSSTPVIMVLLAVSVFHTLNGLRLLTAEFTGFGTGNTKAVFLGTLVLVGVIVVGAGGLL